MVGVSGDIALTPVSGIVYGSSSLALLAAQNQGSIRAEAWYLLNPPTGTAAITVTFSGAPSDAIGGSVSYFNVASVGSHNSASGGGSDPITLTVNANSGDLVIDVLAMSTGSLPSPGLGQTERWNVLANSGTPDGAGSDKPASSPVTMTWTTSPYFGWALIGVDLQPPAPVGRPPAPVGGEMIPINQLQVLVLWLVLTVTLGIVSIATLIRGRRTRNN